MAIITAEPMLPGGFSEAFAQPVVQISSARKTSMISVSIGKTEDVRTDASFVDLVIAGAACSLDLGRAAAAGAIAAAAVIAE